MFKRIEICAPMGVGKSTLAAALAAYGFHPVHEDIGKNPYLKEFYATFSPDVGYRKDKWFVDAHAAQLAALPKDIISVFDYATVLCRAYVDASSHVQETKDKLQAERDTLEKEAGAPSLLIVLDCPLEEQIKRIRTRARAGESDVPESYLRELRAAVEARLRLLPSDAKILHIDAMRDFRDPVEVRLVVQDIRRALSGRAFVPKPSWGP